MAEQLEMFEYWDESTMLDKEQIENWNKKKGEVCYPPNTYIRTQTQRQENFSTLGADQEAELGQTDQKKQQPGAKNT